MSKSIIIIDTPESCAGCKVSYVGYHSDFCDLLEGRLSDIRSYAMLNTKPEWCPLKPMPEKRTVYPGDTSVSAYEVRGYNRCINEILGE